MKIFTKSQATMTIALILFLGIFCNSIVAQSVSVRTIINDMSNKIRDYKSTEAKIMRTEVGMFNENGSATVFRELYVNRTYEIRAFPNKNEVGDVDLYVYKISGDDKVLEILDKSDAQEARVNWTPSEFAIYEIQISASGFSKNKEECGYGIIICMMD